MTVEEIEIMTVEEKLDNFRTICVENARKDSAKAQSAARTKLEASFEEHKEQKNETLRTRVYEETIEVRREFNRIESERRAEIRRKMAKRQAVIENRIFEAVESLRNFGSHLSMGNTWSARSTKP